MYIWNVVCNRFSMLISYPNKLFCTLMITSLNTHLVTIQSDYKNEKNEQRSRDAAAKKELRNTWKWSREK